LVYFLVILAYFSSFDMLYREKSGNPDSSGKNRKWKISFVQIFFLWKTNCSRTVDLASFTTTILITYRYLTWPAHFAFKSFL
jgi:hypothetical protein